jgi:hypothetical protein
MAEKRKKKMKPVMGWALVYRSDSVIRGFESWDFAICKRRSDARKMNDAVTERWGPIMRIARVLITEAK